MLELHWSINERLGGGKGKDFDQPDHQWLFDLIDDIGYEASLTQKAHQNARRTRT
jgi:hypothetical protein